MTRIVKSLSAAALFAVAASGCSLTTFERESCQLDSDCRSVFGANASCGDEGLCTLTPVAPRCTNTFPQDLLQRPELYPNPLVFGSLMDRGEERKVARENSFRLAFINAAAAGGLGDRQLAVVFCDIQPLNEVDNFTLEEAAVNGAQHLVSAFGVPAIMGPSGSDDTLAVFEAVRASGTLVISPSATSSVLTDAEPQAVDDDNPGLLWRTAPPDTDQGAAIAADMLARGLTNVAIIHQDGAYGEGLSAAFMEALGAAITIDSVKKFANGAQRTEAIVETGSSSAQEVLFISSDKVDVQAFYTAVESNSTYDGKSLFLTDAAASTDLVDEALEPLFPRIRGTRPQPLDSGDPVLNIFSGGYSGEFGQDPTAFSFTAHSYDAAWLVLYGASRSLQRESTVTGAGIARGLRRLSAGPAVDIKPSSWDVVKDAMAADESVNVRGASGELDYDPTTEETTGPVEVWQIVETQMGVYEIVPVG